MRQSSNPFVTNVLDTDFLDAEHDCVDLIASVRATGRLYSFDWCEQVPHHATSRADNGWEAMERHCERADRRGSLYFTDEQIAQRRAQRERGVRAWKQDQERKRRQRIVRETRERLARERYPDERRRYEREREREWEEEDPRLSGLSTVARRVLAVVTQSIPGSRLNVPDLARAVMVPEILIHVAIRELVQAGLLTRVPLPGAVAW